MEHYTSEDSVGTYMENRKHNPLTHVWQHDRDLRAVEIKIDKEARERGALDVEDIDWGHYEETGKIRPIASKPEK